MLKKKKLWVVNQFSSLPRYSYGAGERYYYLSEFLYKQGYDVKVFSGAFNHLFKVYPKVTGLFTKESTPFVEFIWVKLKKYRPQQYIWRTLSWFEFTLKMFFFPVKNSKPDIIIVSSMSLVPILYGNWLKRKYGVKFILEIRDIWPKTMIEIGGYSNKHPLSRVLKKIEFIGYKNADHIISVLPDFKKHLNESGFGEKPFTWIPNGISNTLQNITSDTELTLSAGKFNILYAGTVGNANAMEYYIEAARILKDKDDIHFNLLGDGPLIEDIKKLASDLNNVSFLPKVLKQEVHAIIKKADICYIGWHDKPIYNYGVGANKYNDYMLAKKPILSSSNIINDPVKLAKCGLNVPAVDAEAIANGVLTLQKMTKRELKQLGESGYDFLQKNQVYEVLAQQYDNVFND